MRIKNDTWHFLRGYHTRSEIAGRGAKIKTFCNKNDYDVFLLVSEEVLEKLKYEEDVVGFSSYASLKKVYPVYCVAVNTDNIQPILNKYDIEAIWERNGSGEITV